MERATPYPFPHATRVTEAPFDNPDGTPVDFLPPIYWGSAAERYSLAPRNLKAGKNTLIVWQ